MGFAAIVTVLTTLVCRLAPAIGATGGSLRRRCATARRTYPDAAQRHDSAVVRDGRNRPGTDRAVRSRIAGRSLIELQSVKPGFTVDSALTFRVTLPSRSYGNAAAAADNLNRADVFLHARLRWPEGAAGSDGGGRHVVPAPRRSGTGNVVLARGCPATAAQRTAGRRGASGHARYFAAMQIPVLAGRDVTEADTPDKGPVAIINETFARQIYPGDNPIGRAFILNLGNDKPHEIIGVVGDVKLATLEGDVRPTAYLSSRQYAFGLMNFVVRTTGDPGRLGPDAVRVIHDIDPLLPVSALRPLDEVFAESIARPRLTAVAMSIFAAAALLLAALGVYGIVAYSVSQRAREFGIRVALGAKPSQIIAMVVGQNLRIVGWDLLWGCWRRFLRRDCCAACCSRWGRTIRRPSWRSA